MLPAYDLIDLRAGIGNGRYPIDLFVNNVTDKGGINEVNVQRPRTIGLAATVRF